MPSLVSLDAIEEAARRIAGVARRTPLLEAPPFAAPAAAATSESAPAARAGVGPRPNQMKTRGAAARGGGAPRALNDACGASRVFLKCENLQVTGAFKIRGAYNLISRLAEGGGISGVITYSSGNHGQAVALAARRLGLAAVVVMPTTAPSVKIEGARAYGAEVILDGTTSAHRRTRAEAEAARRGLTMVPPFDHPDIIAGQGTVGLEILDDCPAVERIYVPIGGGGLIAGVATAIKRRRADVEVVGVEPAAAATMRASLDAGEPVTIDSPASIADGLLPVRPGDLTFAHARRFVDRVVTADETAIEEAVVWLLGQAKLVVEPSGAVSVAAARAEATGQGADIPMTVVCVLSGGNIAPEALGQMIKKAGPALV